MKKNIKFLLAIPLFFSSKNIFAEWLTLIPSKWELAEKFVSWEFEFDDIYAYLVYLIELLVQLSVVIAFIFILIWAFKYVISLWNDESAQSAKKTILNSILGFVIASLAYVIVDIILRFITQ